MNREHFIKNIRFWNWQDYRDCHSDLNKKSEDFLLRHVLNHGLKENRNITMDGKNIISKKTIKNNLDLLLPKDFHWYTYICLHSDLQHMDENMAKYHYISNGNYEGRGYKISQENKEINYIYKKRLNNEEICGNKILVISLYDEKNEFRFNELKTVLLLNILNPYIKKIAVLYEKKLGLFDEILNDNKIDVYVVNKRPIYDDYFEICNTNYNNEICMVANSDIIFTETIHNIESMDKNEIFCLTRYNIINYEMNKEYFEATYCYMRNNASQDVWIFKSPIKKMNIDLLPGTFTCDSFLNAYFVKQKYKYSNISDEILTLHLQNGITDSQKNTKIRESDVVEVNDNMIVKKEDFSSNYINYIRKDGQRLSVCGINKDDFFYPTGNNTCKIVNKYYNEKLKIVKWCPGCNECRWDKFFPQYLYDLDIEYAEENPFIMEFNEMLSFKGIENKNIKNIFKIKDGEGNILNFTKNETTLIFNDVITTNKLFIYYKHLMFFNLKLEEIILHNNYGIIISGIIKDNESFIEKLRYNIDYIKLFFKYVKIFIYENDSRDNTKNLLKKYFNENEFLCENNIRDKQYKFHYSTMAIARSKCLDFINKQNDLDYPYVLLIDCDLRIDLSMKNIQHALNNREKFDAQFANGLYLNKYYWDSFATRTQEKNIPFYYENDSDGINKYWKLVSNTADAQKPIEKEFTEVISGFGGMALYNKDCFKISEYSPDVEDCEHVPFHEKLFNLGKKLVINRKFIKNYSEEETKGGYYYNNN